MLSRIVATAGIALVATVWLSSTAVAQAPSPRTVLTIHWGSEDFPGTSVVDAAIREALHSRPDAPVNYYAEYLESETFPAEPATLALRDYIRRKYEGRRVDVVIANTTPALQFALRFRDELFPRVPIVFVAGRLPEPIAEHRVAGITGVLSDPALGETLDLALMLHPSVKRVFVVAQAPAIYGYDEAIQAAFGRFSARVELTYIREASLPGLLAAVAAISPPALILYTRYTPADSEVVVYPDEVARFMAGVSSVPIYSAADVYIGSGIVGGMIRGSHAIGTRLGQIARQILDGTPPEAIPIEQAPVVPTFDWRQLQRWGIDMSRLPAGADVRLRHLTAWESYRWYIIGTLLVLAAQLVLIAGLQTQIARRRGAEATLRTSYERIRHLAGRLINAQESARAGIAQDLHDDVCQRLVFVSMAVNGLKNASGDIQAAVTQQAFSDLEQDTNGLFDRIRLLSHDLHPATLRVLGLAPALKAHCAEAQKRHGVQVRFRTEGDLGRLHPDVALCLFRIAQESVRNGVVHGRARHLEVSLARSGEQVELSITDDGAGFDLDAASRNGSGLGLVSMEERARLVGADVHIVSEPGRGTTVRVRASAEPPQPIHVPEPGEPADVTPAGHAPAAG